MADMYAVSGETIKDIADAIRTKTGSDEQMTVASMASAIEGIESAEGFGKDLVQGKYIKNTYVESSNGREIEYSTWHSTDYIPIPNNAKILVIIGEMNIYRCWYDKDKNYISAMENNQIVNKAEGAYFFRLSARTGNLYEAYRLK